MSVRLKLMVSMTIDNLAWVRIAEPERDAATAFLPNADQQDFIATNADSLAEADGNPACTPLLLKLGAEPVGFAMYALDSDDGNYWIYRFMIDRAHQSRGYGTKGLAALIDHIVTATNCPRIMLGVKPANVVARRLYDRAGFAPAGFDIDGETVLCLEMAPDQ